jgi:hypothetical protein
MAGLVDCCEKASLSASAQDENRGLTITFSGVATGLTAAVLQEALDCQIDYSAMTEVRTGFVRLALAGLAARQLGGHIVAWSESGQTLTIRISLPRLTH